jgi:hypothetical protein
MDNEIHIRSNTTGRYLDSSGRWSALRDNARHFPTAAEARNCCVAERLANVEIVVVRDALICMRVPVAEGV